MHYVVASRRHITTALLNVLPAAIDALHRWLEFPRINSKPPLLLMTDATRRNVDLDQILQSHLSGGEPAVLHFDWIVEKSVRGG